MKQNKKVSKKELVNVLLECEAYFRGEIFARDLDGITTLVCDLVETLQAERYTS